MKLTKQLTLFTAITAFTILTFSSCSHKEAFTKSVIVPSASGAVKVKKDKNNNYSINVSVRDLSPPKNLTPSKDTYVIWNESRNGVSNIGQLVSSRSFISRGFKASLTAVSPNKPKRIFITAEDNERTEYPSSQVVLTTEDF
jgi:hypothetical protein